VTRSKCKSSSPLLKNGKAAAKTKTRRAAAKHNSKISKRSLRNIANMFVNLFIKVARRDDLNLTRSCDADFHDCARSGIFLLRVASNIFKHVSESAATSTGLGKEHCKTVASRPHPHTVKEAGSAAPLYVRRPPGRHRAVRRPL
jgi:hypothetical protein